MNAAFSPFPHLLAFAIGLGLFACQRPIDYPLPYEGDRLVVFAQFEPDRAFEVQVGQSVPPLSYEVPKVTHATVTLYADGSRLAILTHQDQGRYRSVPAMYPQPGVLYHVEVEALGFPEVVSIPDSLPPPPVLGPAIVKAFDYQRAGRNAAHRLSLCGGDSLLQDPAYYGLSLHMNTPDGPRLLLDFTFLPISNETDCRPGQGRGLFTPDCLGGSPWCLDLPITSVRSFQPVDTVAITFVAYSALTYTYLQQSHRTTGDLDQVFIRPDPTPSNMVGGYGILMMQRVIHLIEPVQ